MCINILKNHVLPGGLPCMAMKARISLNVLGASLLAGPHSFTFFPFSFVS
jgi:hypothetical protein